MGTKAAVSVVQTLSAPNNTFMLSGVAEAAGVSVNALGSVTVSPTPTKANTECATYSLPPNFDVVEAVTSDEMDVGVVYAMQTQGTHGTTCVYRAPDNMTVTSLAHQLVYGAFSTGVEQLRTRMKSEGLLFKQTTTNTIEKIINSGESQQCCIWLAPPTIVVMFGGSVTVPSARSTSPATDWEDEPNSEWSGDEDVERAYVDT